jgi:hypothetical protein
MGITHRVSNEQRRQMVAEAAYFRAERRGFAGGDPVADWIEAEAEVDERVREIENARLIEHLEQGLVAANERFNALKKKVSSATTGARAKWHADVERLGQLREELRDKVDALRTRGEQAGAMTRQQAERIWDEISDTMHRVAERARQ